MSGSTWAPPPSPIPAPAPAAAARPPVIRTRPRLEVVRRRRGRLRRQLRRRPRRHRAARPERRREVHGAPTARRPRPAVAGAGPGARRATPARTSTLLGRIGLVPQQEASSRSMTAPQFVTRRRPPPAACRTRRRPRSGPSAIVELAAGDRRPVRALSKGNRQRVKVAAALVHDPEVLVLDEPLNGLDPRQRLHLIDLVRRLGTRPDRAVVVSSHVLDEVERFGSRILVIAQGRLAAEGDFRAIRDLMDDRPHRLRVVSEPGQRPRRRAAPTTDRSPACGSSRPIASRSRRPTSTLPSRRGGHGARDGRTPRRAGPARRRPRQRLPLPGGPMIGGAAP